MITLQTVLLRTVRTCISQLCVMSLICEAVLCLELVFAELGQAHYKLKKILLSFFTYPPHRQTEPSRCGLVGEGRAMAHWVAPAVYHYRRCGQVSVGPFWGLGPLGGGGGRGGTGGGESLQR